MALDKSNEKAIDHAKITGNVRNIGEQPQADQTNNVAKTDKDSVITVGEVIIKHVNDREIFLFPYSKNLY